VLQAQIHDGAVGLLTAHRSSSNGLTVWAGLRRGNARPGADGLVTDAAPLPCGGRHPEPGLLRRLPGITAPSAPPERLSVITRGILERLLTSELPLALDRSAADLLRKTVGVVLCGALVPDRGTSGPG
jgi:hypothetical protein